MYGQSSSQDGTVALHGRAPYRTEVSILFLWLEVSTLWWEVETQQPPESTSVLWASLPVYPVLSARAHGLTAPMGVIQERSMDAETVPGLL